jgi:hypothetical protein
MENIRPQLHEILNAVAIARGLTEGIHASLKGELKLSTEQLLDKLNRTYKAFDRIESATQEMRTIVQKDITKNE